jgi:hypothetical protein
MVGINRVSDSKAAKIQIAWDAQGNESNLPMIKATQPGAVCSESYKYGSEVEGEKVIFHSTITNLSRFPKQDHLQVTTLSSFFLQAFLRQKIFCRFAWQK